MTTDLPFIHDRAICETDRIGARTRVWAFAHILPDVSIGEDCNICDGVFIETGASVGDRVTIKCGVQLWDGVRLEDDVFVGPNVTFTNNPFPRSRMYLAEHPVTVVEEGASIGGNATILPGVRIGAGAMIGAGAVVTKDVAAGAVMVGNPARELDRPASPAPARRYRQVADCRIISMRSFADSRGKLMPIEAMQDIPFTPKRLFIISEVPADAGRGAHANLLSDQIIIPVAGGLTVTLFDGKDEAKFRLHRQEEGLFVPATVWNDLSEFTADSRILVLASQPYDEAQYIRDRLAYNDIRKAQA